MERMWRKVNHSFGGRNSKSSATLQSTDTVSSAGGFGDGQVVVAVAGIATSSNSTNLPSSTVTGRRLAASGGEMTVPSSATGNRMATSGSGGCGSGSGGGGGGGTHASTHHYQKSLSQHVLMGSTASSERRRRRRRKSRPKRNGISCVGGAAGDNMSSSGGFYTINEVGNVGSGHRHYRQAQSSNHRHVLASSAPTGTVMMYPNSCPEASSSAVGTNATTAQTSTATNVTASTATTSGATPDVSLRQRAVAKLRMFNFHLNWDLHMTHCKPCGPRLGGSGGNIITRRLCRNRREDNELYRSNSFKFERFERKEVVDELSNTLKKQIAICDDYSLPVDFVKKRPSSFDPCLAEAIPVNPEKWTAPSPQVESVHFVEGQQQPSQAHTHTYKATGQSQCTQAEPPPLPAHLEALSTLPTVHHQHLNSLTNLNAPNNTLPNLPQQHQAQVAHQLHATLHEQPQSQPQQVSGLNHRSQIPLQRPTSVHPPLPNTSGNSGARPSAAGSIKKAPVKIVEGYSDPKDSKRQKKTYHKKGKRRQHKNHGQSQSQHQHQQQQSSQQQQAGQPPRDKPKGHKNKDKRTNYASDSSAPKSSDDEDNQSVKVQELNSPDSISDDLVRPLPVQSHRSPRKLGVTNTDTNKRNPSPYYYSDLLKSKNLTDNNDKENKSWIRQSTISEPPQPTASTSAISCTSYRKSTSLDAPETQHPSDNQHEEDEDCEETEPTNTTIVPVADTPKRYSFTEEGVHIIRCDSPSTTTSEESDCSECVKRREWHARALALVRKTCNVQPIAPTEKETFNCAHESNDLQKTDFNTDSLSMPPRRLIGPAVCACVAPSRNDDADEYFRPRSIFYVDSLGDAECTACPTDIKSIDGHDNSLSQSCNNLDGDDDDDGMAGRTRQIYETAFDCKVAKSDDDLDEVDRITNQSVLLQLNNGNNLPGTSDSRTSKSSNATNRLEEKRLKNSKNQAIQEKTGNSSDSTGGDINVGTTHHSISKDSLRAPNDSLSALTSGIENVQIHEIDQQNNTTTGPSILPMRGYTPSPPSTAPLPIKFPGKHDRFFMNSIKSAPNLPSSNPAHPRLRDLRLPQTSLRQHQPSSSLCTSNENSLTDSSYVNPPSSTSHLMHLLPPKSSSKTRNRPRSFVLESGRVLELRKSHASHHHHVGTEGRRHHDYSSTESIATSSSGGSMESLRSSTSEGNRSTSSSESRHSTSLSSHSSESGSSSAAFPLKAPVVIHSKLHILSPISDKSSQEPGSEISDANKTQAGTPEESTHQKQTPQDHNTQVVHTNHIRPSTQFQVDALKKRRPPPNKTLMHITDEILGSDSGISLHSREDGKPSVSLQKYALPKLNFQQSDKGNENNTNVLNGGMSNSVGLPQDLRDLPFDMPKLRRRKNLQQNTCTSGSATSVDLGELPFDMPKLRRRLRANQIEINNLMVHSTESSSISQASSSHSMRDDNKITNKSEATNFRQHLTLNLNEPRSNNKFGSLDLRGNKDLNLILSQGYNSAVQLIDVSIPLERQGWFHGSVTRIEAETTLRPLNEGSFLVRNCESTKQDYSLSLKGAKGFMHMRIQRNENGQYILGQFSRPFDTIPEMIRHFCLNRLPVRGAEHMCLLEPVIVQLL